MQTAITEWTRREQDFHRARETPEWRTKRLEAENSATPFGRLEQLFAELIAEHNKRKDAVSGDKGRFCGNVTSETYDELSADTPLDLFAEALTAHANTPPPLLQKLGGIYPDAWTRGLCRNSTLR